MSYEDNYDQTARWDAESVREAEQRTQHRSTRSSAERQKLKKKGQRRRFTLWLAFVLITSAILAGVGWLLANDMCSFNKAPVETTIEITRDDNLNTIATKLHDEGLIKYKWFFKAFGRLRHAESRIGIGTYAVDSDMDYDALINRMSNKNASLTANTVKISIPEGYNVRQIIALMDKYGVNTAEKLTDAAMNSDFNYSFIDNNKKGDLTRLEGYLFPDTYEFFVDEDPTHALSRLLDNFNTKMSDELMQKVEASGYSLNQILTIASLIERRRTARTARTSPRSSTTVSTTWARRITSYRSTPRSFTALVTTTPARSRAATSITTRPTTSRCTRAYRPRPSRTPVSPPSRRRSNRRRRTTTSTRSARTACTTSSRPTRSTRASSAPASTQANIK